MAKTSPLKLSLAPANDMRSGLRGDFVFKALLHAIRTGALPAGHRVREEEIAQSLGVSRTPVREALQILQARRLIEFVPGRGVVVIELGKQQVMELYVMREALEGVAARCAAQYASPDEIAALRNINNEFKVETDPQLLDVLNQRFHSVIYDASRNRYVQEALKNLDDALSLLASTTYSVRSRHMSGIKEHRAIITAIEKRDAEAAEAAARAHIRAGQHVRLTMLHNS